jgi:hypothetical protein
MGEIATVYMGWDRKETVAFWVAAHSIIRRSSIPVAIIPLNRENLKQDYWRQRGEYDSTDFSNSRWLVPYLSKYKGWSIFVDPDVLFMGDIADLWSQRDPRYAVLVKKHDHVPREDIKFLGQKQTKYGRKNWSSLMLFNNERCVPLTRHIVNTMSPGLWFHRFEWLPDEDIGEIRGSWNHLVGYNEFDPAAKMVHFTEGGRWHGYQDEYTDAWMAEYEDLVSGDNPVDWLNAPPSEVRSNP